MQSVEPWVTACADTGAPKLLIDICRGLAKSHIALRQCTYSKVRRMERIVAARFDSELAKEGLKATQLQSLSEILRLQPVCHGQLARALSIDPSTLTRNLKPLLTAGWIQVGSGRDARSRSIRITARGQAKQYQAQQWQLAAQRSLVARLGPSCLAELERLIEESLNILATSNDRKIGTSR